MHESVVFCSTCTIYRRKESSRSLSHLLMSFLFLLLWLARNRIPGIVTMTRVMHIFLKKHNVNYIMFQIQIFAKIFWVYRYELRHDAICNCYLVRGRTSHTHIWFESMSFVLPHVFTSSKNCICLPNSYLDVIFSLHFHLYSENALQVARTVFRPIIFLQATLSLHWPAVNLSLCEVDSRIAKKDLFIRRSRAPPEKFQMHSRALYRDKTPSIERISKSIRHFRSLSTNAVKLALRRQSASAGRGIYSSLIGS